MNKASIVWDKTGRAALEFVPPEPGESTDNLYVSVNTQDLLALIRMYDALLGETKLMAELVGSKKIYTGVL